MLIGSGGYKWKRVPVDDRKDRYDTSLNYVILLLLEFSEDLIFNLPSCAAYGNRQAKRNRLFLHERARWVLRTLHEPRNWGNVR